MDHSAFDQLHGKSVCDYDLGLNGENGSELTENYKCQNLCHTLHLGKLSIQQTLHSNLTLAKGLRFLEHFSLARHRI